APPLVLGVPLGIGKDLRHQHQAALNTLVEFGQRAADEQPAAPRLVEVAEIGNQAVSLAGTGCTAGKRLELAAGKESGLHPGQRPPHDRAIPPCGHPAASGVDPERRCGGGHLAFRLVVFDLAGFCLAGFRPASFCWLSGASSGLPSGTTPGRATAATGPPPLVTSILSPHS